MKFETGDETDLALTTAAVHEMELCRQAFEKFVYISSLPIQMQGSKALKLERYNSYASFLQHLYEFYVACFKRDRNDTREISHSDLDKLLNLEVEKLLRNRRHAIEHGYAPSWENRISVYEVDVPLDFGASFRKLRNRTAHVDPKRTFPGELTLGTFFATCHRFVFLLYHSGLAFWSIKDIEQFNWRAIEEFSLGHCG